MSVNKTENKDNGSISDEDNKSNESFSSDSSSDSYEPVESLFTGDKVTLKPKKKKNKDK